MLPKSERVKTLCLLILAQLICISAGLWIHQRFVLSAMRSAGKQSAWEEMKSKSQAVATRVRDGHYDANNVASRIGAARRLLDDASIPETYKVTLVDGSWRVLTSRDNPNFGAQWKWHPTDRVPTGNILSETGNTSPIRGMVVTTQGRHVALVYPHLGTDLHLVIHRNFDELPVVPRAVSRSLWQASAVTFLWTAGVLGIAVYLVVSQLCDQFTRKRIQSETTALRRAESLSRMRDAIIFGLAKLTESRDPETGFHLERIALFSSRLALALRRNPTYRQVITPEFVRLIEISSTLHDIGKVGVEDAVLLKPGPLTNNERERMQKHAIIGGRCIQDIEQRLGSSNFLQMARQIAFWHHERWDGDGYPSGLSAEEIPLAARIVAVADVYEALASKRVYKEPLPHETCVTYIKEESGKHFDPDIVEAFLEIAPQFRDICRQYDDRKLAEQELRQATAAARKTEAKPIAASTVLCPPELRTTDIPDQPLPVEPGAPC